MRLRSTILLLAAAVFYNIASAADWPQWRGPNRDGIAKTSIKSWPKSLKQRWRVTVGEGHSSPIVSGQHVFQFSRENDRETVRCLELKTGKEVWKKQYNAPYKMHPAARRHGKGPKSTPLVADGKLYTLGISGMLTCFDAKDGRVIWRKTFAGKFKNNSPLYGTATSPMLYKAMVIAHVGGHDGGALTAFDAATGAKKWAWDEDGPGYTSPVILTTGGTDHLITQTQNTVLSVDPKTGRELWRLPFKTDYEQNAVTPVVFQDMVIISGYKLGVQCYKPIKSGQRWRPKEVWSSQAVSMYMSTPVLHGELLFGMSHRRSGQLFCASAKTGKIYWTNKGRTAKNAALLVAGNSILVQKTDGEMLVIAASFERMDVKARYRLSHLPTWAHPALVGKSLLVKDKSTLFCYSLE